MQLGLTKLANRLPHFMGATKLIGGLEISDSGLRYVWKEGEEWKLISQRLPVNVVVNGEIKDDGLFLEALKILKKQIDKGHTSFHVVPVIVSLASSEVYLQSFKLPNVREEELDKSIQLNLQMVSPSPLDEVYASWQISPEPEDKYTYEVLSAFLKRGLVDKLEDLLHKARFRPIILESRAMAISRALRELGNEPPSDKASLLLMIDDEGIDFLVLRRGQLYFEYLQLWKNLYGDSHKLSVDEFKESVIRSMHQVMSFYGQRWKDPLQDVFVLAHSLSNEVQDVISKNFNLQAKLFVLKSGVSLGTEWYAALGSALRGEKPRRKDQEISLLSMGAQEEYRWERVIDFLNFWGLLIPSTLVITMIAIFATSYVVRQEDVRTTELLSSIGSSQQIEILDELGEKAKSFNQQADVIRGIIGNKQSSIAPLRSVINIAGNNQVDITRFASSNIGGEYVISGNSSSQDNIIGFKNELSSDGQFQNVNLPPASIQGSPQSGTYSFSMTVAFISANTP